MSSERKSKANIKEIAVFGMLGALMYASKALMELLPNVHLIGVFIIAMTVVYRTKVLYPLYIFVLLTGLLSGFGTWWIPYLYIWTVLWGATMLLPKSLEGKKAAALYALICAAHGYLFGILYAPFQAIMYNLTLEGTLTWIATGLPFDAIHGTSNFICGIILIVPLIKVLKTAEKMAK